MPDIMGAKDIAFPHLGIYLENVPKSFTIFGFTIALYGVVIGIGMLLGILLAAHNAKKENMNPDVIWDFAIFMGSVQRQSAEYFLSQTGWTGNIWRCDRWLCNAVHI